jgi:hypothetical protein
MLLQRRTHWILTFTALLVFGCAQAALAGPMLLGTLNSGGSSSTLVELNPITGAVTRTIGAVGYGVNGLTWDPSSGKLYGGTTINESGYNGLIEIDPATGAGTPVGAADWGSSYDRQAVVAITVNAAGQMYGWCERCYDAAGDRYNDELAPVNTTTGVSSRVGDAGMSTGSLGLAFDNSGALILLNYDGDYYSVNTSTGLPTYLGSIPAEGYGYHHGDFQPGTNLFYTIDVAGSSSPRNIVVADLATGAIVYALPTDPDLHTLTFVDSAAVPEPGTVLLLGLGLAGLCVIRRRRA